MATWVTLDANNIPKQYYAADPGGGAVSVTDPNLAKLLGQPPGVLKLVTGVVSIVTAIIGPSSSAPIEAMTGVKPPF